MYNLLQNQPISTAPAITSAASHHHIIHQNLYHLNLHQAQLNHSNNLIGNQDQSNSFQPLQPSSLSFIQQQQQQHQFSYQTNIFSAASATTTTTSKPKWSVSSNLNMPQVNDATGVKQSQPIVKNSNSKVNIIVQENSDEHFNRHIENLNKSEDDDNNLITDDKEELNEFKLNKLINSNKNKSKTNTPNNNNSKTVNLTNATNEREAKEEEEEEDYYMVNNDEPKVFQVEDVEVEVEKLIGKIDNDSTVKAADSNVVSSTTTIKATSNQLTLLSSPTPSSPSSSLLSNPKILSKPQIVVNNTSNKSIQIINAPQVIASVVSSTAANNSESVMPTPLAYSRSSSMTSLNSFSDVKSIHSSVASEYSHRVHKKSRPNETDIEHDGEDEDENDNTHNDLDELDIIMPDSPLAQAADSSFVVAQRIKHKQQQLFCRQTAQATMLSENKMINMKVPANLQEFWQQNVDSKGLNGLMSQLNIANMHSMIFPSSFILPNGFAQKLTNESSEKVKCEQETSKKPETTESEAKESNENHKFPLINSNNCLINQSNSNVINTPPVKLMPTAPKFIQNNTQTVQTSAVAMPSLIMSNSTMTAPLPQQSLPQVSSNSALSNNQNSTAPATVLPNQLSMPNNQTSAPMSVTYAFMKNSNSNTNNSTASTTKLPLNFNSVNPSQTTQPPKFLMSSTTTSSSSLNSNFSKCILPLTTPANSTASLTVPFSSPNPSSSLSLGSYPMSKSAGNNQSPPMFVLPQEEELPCSYANESSNRLINRQLLPDMNFAPSSPPESICSRMSDTSIPSLIKQDISSMKTKFQSMANNPNPNVCNDFKALFTKLSSNNSNSNLNKQMNSNGFASNANEEDYFDEKPKKFLNEEENLDISMTSSSRVNTNPFNFNQQQQHQQLSIVNNIYNANANGNPPLFLFKPNSNTFQTQPAFISNLQQAKKTYAFNNSAYNHNSVMITTEPPKISNFQNETASRSNEDENAEENEQEDQEQDDNLNITTKPMNTPAGFCSLSGASFIDVSTDEDNQQQKDIENEKTNEDGETKENLETAEQKEIDENEANKNYIDLDLENFINEMLPQVNQKQPQLSPTDSVKTNLSLKCSSTRKPFMPSKLVKRASLQNIDIVTSNASKNSSNAKTAHSSNMESSKRLSISNESSKQLLTKPANTQPNQSNKRLSEDNTSKTKAENTSKTIQNKSSVQTKPTNFHTNMNSSNTKRTNTLVSNVRQAKAPFSNSTISSKNAATNPVVSVTNSTKAAQLKVAPKAIAKTTTGPTAKTINKPITSNVNSKASITNVNSTTKQQQIAKPTTTTTFLRSKQASILSKQQLNQSHCSEVGQLLAPKIASLALSNDDSLGRRNSFSFGSHNKPPLTQNKPTSNATKPEAKSIINRNVQSVKRGASSTTSKQLTSHAASSLPSSHAAKAINHQAQSRTINSSKSSAKV